MLAERRGGEKRYSDIYLAGACAGLTQSFITGPVDVVKNRMQVAGGGHGHGGGSPVAMVKDILAQRGPRGLLLGFGPTLARDVPGIGVFFLTYEYLRQIIDGRLPPPLPF
jgi:solute carrier family 25 (mitochondrial carnitine/acylcarnitine transporter), member 20/29